MSLKVVENMKNDYETQQKAKLVELGQSTKAWKDIIIFLESEFKTSRKMSDFRHGLFGFKNDTVYQLHKAVELLVGAAQGLNEEKPSGGQHNLQMIDVILADGTRKKVPYGKIELPEMGKDANIDIAYDHKTNTLFVTGSCEFRYACIIDNIVDKARYFLNTESMYKDQAIQLDSNYEPEILDLSNIEKEFMVLSEKTEYEMQPLWARILKPQECIKRKIPLKTGVLLEGPYGSKFCKFLQV